MFDGISIDVKPPPSPFGPTKDRTWYVSGGYDAFDVAEKLRNLESEQEKGEYAHYLLESLQKLAVAVQGGSMTTTTGTLALSDASSSSSSNSTDDDKTSKIPVITVPHGAVTDGGFALCMGSYVLATPETSFKIMNPSRGLSLDPIGLSFILPRLGWEHSQLSSKYSQGCGFILALAGFEADSFDMVQTGLATHLVADSVSGALPILEEELAMMEPWNQQGLVKPYKRFYGEDTDASTNSNSTNNNMLLGGGRRFDSYRGGDANRDFRNKRIAYLMDQVSDHAADMKSGGAFPYDFAAIYEGSDASLDTDDVPWDTGFFSSPLVDIAAHLDRSVFQKQKSLEELINLLQQEGAKADERLANYNGGGETAADGADHVDGFIDGINVAKDLADRMTRQSPLALRVVYHLLEKGCRNLATIEKCMEAELRAQHAMMSRQDFTNWSEHVRKHGGDEQSAPPFTGWQHRSVKDVTADEVKEIVGE
jgi:enoyl-CoA hydratase/carnithine racemase